MKKSVAFILVAVLLITLCVPAFARPICQCHTCGNELSVTYGSWRTIDSSYHIEHGQPVLYLIKARDVWYHCHNEHTVEYKEVRANENYTVMA